MRVANQRDPAGAVAGRLPDVDALRGFALLGIVAVNATQIAGSWGWTPGVDPAASTLTLVVRYLVTLVFATKFYLLFSFLFGYSFTLQLDSARRAGARFEARYLRRLGALLVLGVAHAVLLYVGDILTTYAVLGLVLLALHQLRPDQAVRAAGGIIGVLGVLYLLVGVLVLVASVAGAGGPAPQQLPVEDLAASYRGAPSAVIGANLELLPTALTSIVLFQAPSALAMFLLGLAAGRRDALGSSQPDSRVLRRVVVLGLSAGIPGAALFAASTLGLLGTAWAVVALGVDILTAPALSGAYAAALLLALRSGWGGRVRAALAPAGRLALTNYLSQSLLLALVFTGYGLALYDRLGALPVFGVAVAVFAAQLAASAGWVRYLRYGPAEWVLRAVTYARFPPMRR